MLCKELHHLKDFVVIPLGILAFSTSFTHTEHVSNKDDKQDSSVDNFMLMLPVGYGLSWWVCVIGEINGIDGGEDMPCLHSALAPLSTTTLNATSEYFDH